MAPYCDTEYPKPYVSAENIDKGERWSIDIAKQLEETNYGLVCVTPDNINAPWILFESGALSKSIQNSRVSPIMFGLEPSDFTKSPVLQFQLTRFAEDEILKLLNSINNSGPEPERVSQDVLKKSFSRAWAELSASVASVPLESLQRQGIETRLTDKGSAISPSTESAIQELLTISRSQIKILNSPPELLPPEYLERIFAPDQVGFRSGYRPSLVARH